MDYETRKEINKLKARVKELEARLAVASMPSEVSALIEDLEMVPDTEEEKVTLEMMEEFIKDMGYQTWFYPELESLVFTDMYKDYKLVMLDESHIRLSLCEELEPDVNRNILYLIAETKDMSTDIRFDWEKGLIEFSVYSVGLTQDSFRSSLRFFINLLNEAEYKLESYYNHVWAMNKKRIRAIKYS